MSTPIRRRRRCRALLLAAIAGGALIAGGAGKRKWTAYVPWKVDERPIVETRPAAGETAAVGAGVALRYQHPYTGERFTLHGTCP